MEKLKVKHDHKLTDIVKVCMFSLFLLLPLLMFLPNGLYFAFNEHAKLSTETPTVDIETEIEYSYKYETNVVNTRNDLVEGNVYYMEFESQDNQVDGGFDIYIKPVQGQIYVEDITLNFTLEDSTLEATNDSYLRITYNGDNGTLAFWNNGYEINNYLYDYIAFECSFIYIGYEEFYLESSYSIFQPSYYNEIESATANSTYTIDYNESTITDVMYKGWQQVWETPLFTWTGTNNFSFTIKAFTNVFGISQESYIANYLCYIMTLLVIYIIYDIIIVLFTKMTHIFNE